MAEIRGQVKLSCGFFFGRFAKTWRNGAGAKDRFLTDETNKFESFADKNDQLYKQLDRVVRLVEYIDNSQAGRADETNDQVVYRYEYKDEEQRRQNKRSIIGENCTWVWNGCALHYCGMWH